MTTTTSINTLYVPVSAGDDGAGIVTTSLDGLMVLFVHRWSGGRISGDFGTRVALVNRASDSAPVFRVRSSFSSAVLNGGDGDNENALTVTTLPFLVLGESPTLSPLTVSGSAGVCRHLVRNSEEPRVHDVLGFRGNCLQAPAEVSIWTAFCEVQMPNSVGLFLNQPDGGGGGEVVELPMALVQLEEHLKQPIRMHNVVRRYQLEKPHLARGQLDAKEVQKSASALLDHDFAEGPDMTLADLLLYPCVRVAADRLVSLGIDLAVHLPRVARWLHHTMKPLVAQAWAETVGDEDILQIPDLSGLRIQPPPAVIKVPRVEEVSLYRKDVSRLSGPGRSVSAEETTRVVELMKSRRLWLDEEEADVPVLAGLLSYLDISVCPDDQYSPVIDWSSLPGPAHPEQGHVPGSRLERKIQQLDGMVAAVISSVSEGDVIVDFCSGGGHLGIVLAYLLPRCRIVMVDNKEESVRQARLRLAQLRLPNALLVQSNLDYFRSRFDLGVALHACGVATDLVLRSCLAVRAAFVLCPCCYGNLALPDLPVQYPQSQLYQKKGISPADHSVLARMADHVTPTGRLAMAAVDLDRVALAAEDGYRVTLSKLKPDSCSPKHDLLVGIP